MQVRINIKEMDGKTFPIFSDSDLSIKNLKQKIKNHKGLSIEQQQLFFDKKLLEDEKLLKDYLLKNEDTIFLIPRLDGGGFGGFKLLDINKIQEKEFGDSAPSYRTVYKGVNIHASCNKCKEDVFIPLGFSRSENEFFDLGMIRTKLSCPNCNARIIPRNFNNLYFYQCAWKFECLLGDASKSDTRIGYTKNDNKCSRFDEANGTLQDYASLHLRVIPKPQDIGLIEKPMCNVERHYERGLETLNNFDFNGPNAKAIKSL